MDWSFAYSRFPFHWNNNPKQLANDRLSIPYMQPKMHCKDFGKLFAAAIDRQKTDISLTFKEEFAGAILRSSATVSDPGVPVPSVD